VNVLPTNTSIAAPSSFSQKTPGCGPVDPRFTWSLNHAILECQSAVSILHKVGSWDGTEPSRLGQLVLAFPGQSFPSRYTVVVTVSNLYDPYSPPTGNHGGCAGVTVHISSDGGSHDTLYVCRDGTFGYHVVVGNQEAGGRESSVTASPSSTYVMDVSVDGQHITYTVNNSNYVTQTMDFQTTNGFSSAIALDQVWRNDGATAGFQSFSFNI
jgi:hypothetical protein